jgi:tetrahydromethanopterin S-methyltransferase subunit B
MNYEQFKKAVLADLKQLNNRVQELEELVEELESKIE